MLRRVLPAQWQEPPQRRGRVGFTTQLGIRPPDEWQGGGPSPRRLEEHQQSPGAAQLPSAAGAGRTATATGAAPPAPALSFELDIGDLLVGHDSEIVRSARHAVHSVERVEQRLQRRAAALPAGVRRLLAGGIAGAAGKLGVWQCC